MYIMLTYKLCVNAYDIPCLKHSKLLYIDGQPKIQGNIFGYINNYVGEEWAPNYEFYQCTNDK